MGLRPQIFLIVSGNRNHIELSWHLEKAKKTERLTPTDGNFAQTRRMPRAKRDVKTPERTPSRLAAGTTRAGKHMKETTVDRRKPLHELNKLMFGRRDRKTYHAVHPELGRAELKRGQHGWKIIHYSRQSGFWRSIKHLKAELIERGYTEFVTTLS